MMDPSSLLDRALAALDKAEARLAAAERARTEPIAIVGMGCRFPGHVSDPRNLWRLCADGVDAIGAVPEGRWPDAEPAERGRTPPEMKWAGLVDDVDRFDAAFFGISPREAELLDPQQRLLLEVAQEALDDAGAPAQRLEGIRGGVFVGIYTQDYQHHLLPLDVTDLGVYGLTGTMNSVAAGRIAHHFGWRGPTLSIDTACSSSLVAVHLACQSLRLGECDLALAGGVNLILSARTMRASVALQALSPDGRCRAFDARANGFVRAEGCGLVVLKRLADARRDDDRVLALIRGSAVNHDGRAAGLTAPSLPAQVQVIRQAWAAAQVKPEDIDFVEAHGTGTPLGDPIEVEALAEALGGPRADGRPCALGSIKTNLGHTEAAAGVAGLMKCVLSLAHETIAPNLHFDALNPRISLDGTPLVIPVRPMTWPRRERPRVAAVSSFGLSGTNAHVVIEEAPRRDAPAAGGEAPLLLVPLSARSAPALAASAAALAAQLADEASPPLVDVAHTLATRRTHFEHRLATTARSTGELAEALAAFARGEPRPGTATGRATPLEGHKVVFVFSGQGSQWLGMGRELLDAQPVFAATLRACDAAMRPFTGWSLVERVVAGVEDGAPIHVVQPVLSGLQIALAALWRSLCVEPAAVVGHSMGEVAAAAVAGALSLEDAARVITQRSALMSRNSRPGAMAVVELPAAEVEALLATQAPAGALSVAAHNSPSSTVVSGDAPAVATLVERLTARGIDARPVKVDVASHSAHMDRLRDELLQALAPLRPRAATVPMWSTVTGQLLSGVELDADYWMRNVRQPVLFTDAVARLFDGGATRFIEVSPHPVLLHAVEQTLRARAARGWTAVGTLRRAQPERRAMLESLATLHCAGFPVDWARLQPAGAVATLPPYPWQRERFWAPRRSRRPTETGGDPLLGRRISSSRRADLHTWETTLAANELDGLTARQIGEAAILPDAGWLALAAAVADGGWAVEEATIHAPLVWRGDERRRLQTVLEGAALYVSSRPEAEDAAPWTLHLVARLSPSTAAPPAGRAPVALFDAAMRTAAEALGAGEAAEPLFLAGVRRLQPLGGAGASFAGEAERRDDGTVDVRVRDEGGRVVLTLEGVRLAPLSPEARALVERPPLLRQTWVAAPSAPRCTRPRRARWLVCGGPPQLAQAVAAALEARGQRVRLYDYHDELDAAIAAAFPDGAATGGIVQLDALVAPDLVHADVQRSAARTLALVQALARRRARPRLWLVTAGAQSIGGADAPVAVAQAALWGLGRALANEHPELRCTRLDVDPKADPRRVAELIADELGDDGDDDELVWRGAVRHVGRVDWQPPPPPRDLPPLRADATYLVTGGLGGLGLACARWLVERGARALLLVGRRPPDAAQAESLAALRARGAEVRTAAVDVADRVALAGLLDGIPVAGVIHAAGVLDDALAVDLTPERLAAVLAPKVRGALHLHELLSDRALDFFLLFSSAAGLIGSPGQSAYAAGNAFLDALAEHRRALGLPALSVQWGPFSEVGLAAAQADRGARLARQGLRSLTPAEGLAWLERLLPGAPPVVAVMPLDARRWFEAHPALRRVRRFSPLAPAAAAAALDEPLRLEETLRARPPDERLAVIEDFVRRELARVLRLDPARIDRDGLLSGLGVDSLMAMELRNRIESQLSVRVPVTLLWKQPTLAAATAFLLSEWTDAELARTLLPADAATAPAAMVELAL